MVPKSQLLVALLLLPLATTAVTLSISDLNDRLGTTLGSNGVCDGSTDIDSSVDIPEAYDIDTGHPECPYSARAQGSCGSCWAFATTSMLALRSCIAHDQVTQGLELSPQELVSCDTETTNVLVPPSSVENQGCNGGYLDLALKYLEGSGVALEPCIPYDPANVDDCEKAQDIETDQCTNEPGTLRFTSQRCYELSTEEDIQRDILAHGPVVTGFDVYENFATYSSGVHKCGEAGEGSLLGGHAVVITGWGVDDDDDTPYWRVLNSWGAAWGENGSFRIRRGSDDCRFESFVLGAASQEEAAEFNCASWGICPSCLDVGNVGEWVSDCALGAYYFPTLVASGIIGAVLVVSCCCALRCKRSDKAGDQIDRLESKVDAIASAQKTGGAPVVVNNFVDSAPPNQPPPYYKAN